MLHLHDYNRTSPFSLSVRIRSVVITGISNFLPSLESSRNRQGRLRKMLNTTGTLETSTSRRRIHARYEAVTESARRATFERRTLSTTTDRSIPTCHSSFDKFGLYPSTVACGSGLDRERGGGDWPICGNMLLHDLFLPIFGLTLPTLACGLWRRITIIVYLSRIVASS